MTVKNKFFNAEAVTEKPEAAKTGALSICQRTSECLVPKVWLIDIPNAMDVMKTQGTRKTFTSPTPGFRHKFFSISRAPKVRWYNVLKYLKIFRPLLTVLIGPVVKSVYDQRLEIKFRCSNNSYIM